MIEWFDEECRYTKSKVNKKRKSFQEALRNGDNANYEVGKLKTEYFSELKEFNSLKENDYWIMKKANLHLLNSKNPNEFWRRLILKKGRIDTKFTKNELFEYFSRLSSDENARSDDRTNSAPENHENNNAFDHIQNDLPDRQINIEEIKTVIANSKNGKAAGLDKIIPELIKALDEKTLDIFVLLLNKILDNGVFPEEWTSGVVVILYKEGERSDLNNYRGITLLSMPGKILVGVLNNRLTEFVKQADILLENQCGFRKGYQTTYHIFTLFTLIDHNVNKEKEKLFLCFVDFKKAFDKVDHSFLWKKSISIWYKWKIFMTLIRSMYSQVKSCVRSKYGITNFFKFTKGVRQGCLLSPLLFALFLNDLEDYLTVNGTSGIDLWDIKIYSLLYADDLILISNNEEDVKAQMRILGNYALEYKMEINSKKTKVMVLQ